MPLYTYKAVSPEGRMVFGRIDAINLVDLEMRLRRMELDLVSGEPVSNRSLLGTMNDFAFMAQGGSARWPEPDTPMELMRFLAQTPILPLKGARPIDLTRAAFRGE